MIIKTTRFGDIEGDENLIFKFKMPILGYEDETEFIIVEQNQNSLFKWLQSTKTPELAFSLATANSFNIDYSFDLPDLAENILEIKSAEELIVLNIVAIPHENPRKSTMNLLAPIVFNISNNSAGQVILSGSGLSVTYPLFKDEITETKAQNAKPAEEQKD